MEDYICPIPTFPPIITGDKSEHSNIIYASRSLVIENAYSCLLSELCSLPRITSNVNADLRSNFIRLQLLSFYLNLQAPAFDRVQFNNKLNNMVYNIGY